MKTRDAFQEFYRNTKMEHKNIKLMVLLLGISLTTLAQQTTVTAGGDASGSGGTVAYSVGQVVYTADTDVSGTVSQGVQQAREIFTVDVKEAGSNISLSLFPNPTNDKLTLQIHGYDSEKLRYHLYDMQGKLLSSGQIVSQQTFINTANLPPATYFINIIQENTSIRSFKILKL